ncbi:unnamed protein product [Protopolystoma xenopodis]|uniref:Uncharacterized protein n=1 Tax=Protopolystoma xenopodis TaxID=117903 RepID=A0A3S5C6S7_9PLAT|nr:unnamed protein product [Protopolystoma xenopodis]
MVQRMARLTHEADYDAGETSRNVTRPRSDFGNYPAYNGLRTSQTTYVISCLSCSGVFSSLQESGSWPDHAGTLT